MLPLDVRTYLYDEFILEETEDACNSSVMLC